MWLCYDKCRAPLRRLTSLCTSQSLVSIAGSKSDSFLVRVGLRQGPLSPILFITFMDRISRHNHGVEGVRFGDLRIGFCCLQTMWSCWLHWPVTSSYYWIALQRSVKRPGWESAPLNLRSWFSAGKRCSALSTSRRRFCLYSGRTPKYQLCGLCTCLLWWRGSWGKKRSSRFTSWFLFVPLCMVASFLYWPKEDNHGLNWLKWASSVWWLGSPLEKR